MVCKHLDTLLTNSLAIRPKFFYENLFDGDVASNLLSWRWVAGLQTLGKKYIATEENINKYTNNRYLGFKLPKVRNILLKNEDRSLNSISASKSLQETYKNCAFCNYG